MERPAPDLAAPHLEQRQPAPLVVVHPDGESLAWAAAALVAGQARRAVEMRGRFAVALAGGSTPKRTYQVLSRSPFAELVPWACVDVFWGDERCLDAADPRSNQRMARDTLLDHVPIPPGHIHPMWCPGGAPRPMGGLSWEGESPAEGATRRSADDYDRLLRGFFGETGVIDAAGRPASGGGTRSGLDLVLLGLGDDGHTASLFPGSEALQETLRWAAPVFAGGGAESGGPGWVPWRITLTASFINKSAAVLFMASGRSKAAAVREVLEGPIDPARLPAQLIMPESGALHWYLDDESAALLIGRPQE